MTAIKAPDLSIEMFGGVLYADSAGAYPGLELFSFLLGVEEGILPSSPDIKLKRYAHDFARRLVHDESLPQESKQMSLQINIAKNPSESFYHASS